MAEQNRCPQCGGELPDDAPQGLCPQCLMKLGLPTGAEADKAIPSGAGSDVPTSATPPGRFVPPEPGELAKQFPQLEVIELLGQGGMGAVYKARQKQLDRLVALKILSPQVGQDPAFAERFVREARSLAKLNHPYIVTVYDFGQTEEGLFYFVMEFVEGTDLRHVIQAGELSPREALAIVPQICQALQYAHDEGIVHRDIKPENILIDKNGRVKIADFGLAKLLDRPATVYTLTQAGQRMGTPHYMAPEQIEHPGQVDHRADIYSLGVVFYEMLTGELPLGRFAPPSKKVQVDVQLDKVVLRTLEKEPERRYQHASEVKTDVEAISNGGQVVPAAAVGIQVSRMEKHITVVAAISIAFGTLGILIGIFFFVVISSGGLISGDPMAMNITGIVGAALGGFFILTSVPEVIAGIGLLKRRSWARILAIILAILDLINIPIGTAIGIYALWVLVNDETAKLFAEASVIRKKEEAYQTKRGRPSLVLAFFVIAASFLVATIYVAGVHGSFPWFAFVLAPLLVILAVFAFKRSKLQEAPADKNSQETTGAKGGKGKLVLPIVVIVAVFLFIGLFSLAVVALGLGWFTIHSVEKSPSSGISVQTELASARIGRLDFPYGIPEDLTFGTEGPTLSDECTRTLELEPSEAAQVHKILRRAYRQYLELERQNTQQYRAVNSLTVIISPFRQEAESFLKQFWADLDSILDEQKRTLARRHLPLGQMFGAFQFGGPEVTIAVTEAGGTFHYSTAYKWERGSGKSGVGTSGSGSILPPEYHRFWEEPATDK